MRYNEKLKASSWKMISYATTRVGQMLLGASTVVIYPWKANRFDIGSFAYYYFSHPGYA
jgi:hypothetical protein